MGKWKINYDFLRRQTLMYVIVAHLFDWCECRSALSDFAKFGNKTPQLICIAFVQINFNVNELNNITVPDACMAIIH